MTDQSLEWETHTSNTTYSCPGFTIHQDTVTLPDGEQTTFDYLVDDESVVIIPFTESGTVVIIEEWRQAVSRISRGFPAGGVEQHDASLAATAHRELTEETGYTAAAVEHLLTVEPANGISNAVHHYFVANGCVADGNQSLDDNESIRVDTIAFNELFDAVQAGEIQDGRTVLGALYYALTRETSELGTTS